MAIMIHAKFHFNRLMLSLNFGIRASEPGDRLKRPGLIWLKFILSLSKLGQDLHVDKKAGFFQLQREVGTGNGSAEKMLGGLIKLSFTEEELYRESTNYPPIDQHKCAILRGKLS